MLWMGMSSKVASDRKSKQAVNQETYWNECIDKRTIAPNIIRMEIICFDQSASLKYCLTEKNLPFISRVDNPPKLIQLRLHGL